QAEGKRQAVGNMTLLVKSESPAKTLHDLKGKKLASNHLQSPKYLSKVVFDGKIDVEKFFVLVPQTSMIRSLKAVERGEADAALLGPADMDYLKANNSPYLQTLRVLWESSKIPPTPVVMFKKRADPKEAEKLTKALTDLCNDTTEGGAKVCE